MHARSYAQFFAGMKISRGKRGEVSRKVHTGTFLDFGTIARADLVRREIIKCAARDIVSLKDREIIARGE